jgi:hypothetical protein
LIDAIDSRLAFPSVRFAFVVSRPTWTNNNGIRRSARDVGRGDPSFIGELHYPGESNTHALNSTFDSTNCGHNDCGEFEGRTEIGETPAP